jgi:hypothetical protein
MHTMTGRLITMLLSLEFVLPATPAQNWNFVARLNPELDDIVRQSMGGHEPGQSIRGAGWHESGSEGEYLLYGPGRLLDYVARRQTPGHCSNF